MNVFGLKFRIPDSMGALFTGNIVVAMSMVAPAAIFTALFFGESPCEAGGFLAVGPQWVNFVFEPKVQEETPNYYGYGARASAGYSVDQVVDLALYGEYSPGRLNSASSSGSTAVVLDYGAEIGFRILQTMYIAARGGQWKYQLSRRTAPEEVGGAWTGVGGAASFGLLLPVNKEVQWQTSIDIGQALVKKTNLEVDDVETKARVISRASVTISFVYNARDTVSAWGSLFN